jgi:hypothetical protein
MASIYDDIRSALEVKLASITDLSFCRLGERTV